MIKKIFFIALFTMPLLGADHNKKIKTGETPIETQSDVTIGFDCIPDEIALSIPTQFTNRQSYCLDDLKSLVSLSRVSKRMYALVHDKNIVAQQSTQNLLITHSRHLKNRINELDYAQKTELLDAIDLIPSDNLKVVTCQRLADLKEPLFSKPIHHALISHAIEKSNLPLFQSCYTMFNIAQDSHISSALRFGAVLVKKLRIHMTNTNSIMQSAGLSSEQEHIRLQTLKDNAEKIEKQLSH